MASFDDVVAKIASLDGTETNIESEIAALKQTIANGQANGMSADQVAQAEVQLDALQARMTAAQGGGPTPPPPAPPIA